MTIQSKYCYPGTDILKNRLDIKDQTELMKFENIVTTNRLGELQIQPIKGKFDWKHLSKIHNYIFQDVYPFAGKIRDENISKGSTRFASAEYIVSSYNDLYQTLLQEQILKNMPKDRFAERAAFYMSELNVIHPFREGNGRSQREFIRCLASDAGHPLDWGKVHKNEILQATIESVYHCERLARVILNCIS